MQHIWAKQIHHFLNRFDKKLTIVFNLGITFSFMREVLFLTNMFHFIDRTINKKTITKILTTADLS